MEPDVLGEEDTCMESVVPRWNIPQIHLLLLPVL